MKNIWRSPGKVVWKQNFSQPVEGLDQRVFWSDNVTTNWKQHWDLSENKRKLGKPLYFDLKPPLQRASYSKIFLNAVLAKCRRIMQITVQMLHFASTFRKCSKMKLLNFIFCLFPRTTSEANMTKMSSSEKSSWKNKKNWSCPSLYINRRQTLFSAESWRKKKRSPLIKKKN